VTEVRVKTYQLRAELSEILTRVAHQNTRATIMRHGEPIAYVVSQAEIDELDRLRKMFAATYVHKAVNM
jgi:prevent-host-death family protein